MPFKWVRLQSENSSIPFLKLEVPLGGSMKSIKLDECLQSTVSVTTYVDFT